MLEDKDGWAKSRYGEGIGYVRDDYISFVSPGKDGKEGKPEVQRIHIVSSGGKVNIRRGNGTGYSVITSVVPGSALLYIATAVNGWYAVRTGKQVGWVSPDYAYLFTSRGAFFMGISPPLKASPLHPFSPLR